MPQTLESAVHSELLIRKSRFIGCVRPMTDRAAAQAEAAALRAAHPGAAHVCWALLAGGQSAAVDDGEPSGTAGRPMFEVLRHQDLDGVLATAVRYYGGVRLGAGGLVRAYTNCIAQALLGATRVPVVRRRLLRCALPYPLEGRVRRELELAGATLEGVSHGALVELSVGIAADRAPALQARLQELGQGRIVWAADGGEPGGRPRP